MAMDNLTSELTAPADNIISFFAPRMYSTPYVSTNYSLGRLLMIEPNPFRQRGLVNIKIASPTLKRISQKAALAAASGLIAQPYGCRRVFGPK